MTNDLLPDKTPFDQQWLGSILRPALIVILIGCLNIALLSMLLRLYPGLASGYAQTVIGLSLLAVLLACATTTWLAQPGKRHLRRPIYRLAEFLFLLLMARLLVWLTLDGFPSITQLLYRPLEGLLDGPFIFAAIVISLSWLFAGELTADLLRLALQPDELFAIEEDRIGELIRTSNSDRPAILQRLVSRWVAGGILLVLIAASVRLERPAVGFLAITRQNIDPMIIAAVIIYFLAGLLLISQGQLAILRTRWLLDRVPTSEQVLGQWPLYVIGLLLGIGLLAALLPFGGTFYLAQILSAIVTFFFNAIFGIFRFFMGLLLLLIAALSGEAPEAPPEAPPPPPPAPMIPEAAAQAAGLPEWAGGALFWVVMALFLSYAAYIYLSDKGVQFTWLRAFWQLLRARWRALFGSYQQWQQTRLRRQASTTVDPEGSPGRRASRRRGWRHLDPSQQVRYFYLTMVERAAASGVARAAGETPAQYAIRLRDFLMVSAAASPAEPDESTEGATASEASPLTAEQSQSTHGSAEVSELTNAFMRIRYARQVATAPEASALATIWQKISDRLQLTKR
jgi:hypothetical protein